MNLAYVLSWVSRNAGGLYSSVSGLAKAVADMDETRVRVFGSRDEFSDEDGRQWRPVEVHTLPVIGPQRLCYTPQMRRTIETFAPDVVHSSAVWTYQAAVVNQVHARKGIPYLLSIRGTLHPLALRRSAWKKAIALRLYQQQHFDQAACLHALNESEVASIRRYGLKNPVCVIPNGIDLPEDGGQRTEDRGRKMEDSGRCVGASVVGGLKAEGRKVLLYLGRIHPIKGVLNLIEAWGKVQTSEWVLAIAGWDEVGHEAEIKRLATKLGIVWADVREKTTGLQGNGTKEPGSVVRGPWSLAFLGPQFGEAKAACYRDCDAFILPSFTEGMPMTVLEGWAYSKPVLMTPQCNLPAGFAAEAAIKIEANAESIAQKLEELFRAPQSALRALGANGRRLVAEKFAWPRIAREMRSVYDWVLGGGSPPACIRFA